MLRFHIYASVAGAKKRLFLSPCVRAALFSSGRVMHMLRVLLPIRRERGRHTQLILLYTAFRPPSSRVRALAAPALFLCSDGIGVISSQQCPWLCRCTSVSGGGLWNCRSDGGNHSDRFPHSSDASRSASVRGVPHYGQPKHTRVFFCLGPNACLSASP